MACAVRDNDGERSLAAKLERENTELKKMQAESLLNVS